MTSQDFVNWLKGFVAGSNNHNLTPKGWEELKEQLSRVSGYSTTLSSDSITTTNLPYDSTITYTTKKEILHD